jgi:hypothetical protein
MKARLSLCFFIFFCLFEITHASNWQLVQKNSEYEVFIDLDSISGPSSNRNFLVKRNSVGGTQIGRSFLYRNSINCGASEVKTISGTAYSDLNFQGGILPMNFPDIGIVRQTQGNSLLTTYQNFACSNSGIQDRDTTASYKYIGNLSSAKIYSEIISQSLNQTDLNILVEMYSMIWSANDQAFNPPPINSTRAIGRNSLFFWQKNSIASALKAYEDTFDYLGSSIGITGNQFKLAIGIQEIIVPQTCSNCDPAYKSLRTQSEDVNNDMVYRGMVNWARYSNNPGLKSTPEGNANPHYELSLGSFFDYYTNFIPSYFKPKALALRQKGQLVERQMALDEDKAEKKLAWLNSPEGQRYTASQELKAEEDKATARAKLAADYPFYALVNCSVGATGSSANIAACLLGRTNVLNTQLELRNGTSYGLYEGYELDKIGEVTKNGFLINLKNNFSIKVQNSSATFTLGIKVFERSTNKLLYQKQVPLWGVISVSN